MKIIKTKLNYAKSFILLNIDSLTIGSVTLFDIFIKKKSRLYNYYRSGNNSYAKPLHQIKKTGKFIYK
ncbi:MAG: hypothetical protein M0Q20_04155 [Sulfurimonas sp.]|nr:hypothetical protein [Sulfurimonas sp.]